MGNGKNPDPASASWDWNADANQRAMLLKRERGADRFELFSNSPMWWMCANDNPSGAAKGSDDNLQFAQFAGRRVPPLVLADRAEPSKSVCGTINSWMRKHRPDAIISTEYNPRKLLEAAGYRVPQDVALAAANVANCDASAGMLESPREVGRVAAMTLIALIQRGEFGLPENQQDIFVRGIWTDGDTLPVAAHARQASGRTRRRAD